MRLRDGLTLLLFVAACRCERAPVPISDDREGEAEPMPSSDPDVPGVRAEAELVARLQAALEAKGAEYEPRTHHLAADGSPTYTNRLILESSPYLLQHAHNPVNWHPWGDEAFERARREGKPVFLSVGYSTCHWCHVMERESFEDVEIATFLNQHFVPIKVDREERPDVDELYMTAVQMLTGRGGWPMTVVMTPHGEPFFGGTYFPPRDGARGARRGFLSILRELAARYREQPGEVVAEAQALSQRIQSVTAPRPPGDVPGPDVIPRSVSAIARGYDRRFGGFGRAPKFPQPSRLGLLLRHQRRAPDERLLAMAVHTFDAMARGGMYDQIGGGFHRYSTDPKWLVPHFEKMLYDNAQLAVSYVEAWQTTGDARHARIATEVLDYVTREMTAPSGGFYSATDADSPVPDGHPGAGHREEGWFFTWTPDEVEAVIGADDAEALNDFWDITELGNFEGRSIAWVPRPLEEVAAEQQLRAEELQAIVARARPRLYEVRARRPPPLRDDKVLTAWSGLMISAFARAGLALGRDDYVRTGARAAEFLLEHLRDEDGRLMRSWLGEPGAGGRARHRAYLDDYAALIRALLDLHEATGTLRWVEEALRLQAELDAHFGHEGPRGGGYWMTADDAEELLARDKPSSDGALPSGNALAADNLLRLAELTQDDALRTRAERLFAAFSDPLRRRGPGMTRMLAALDRYHDLAREIVIVGAPDARQPLLDVVRRTFLPNRVLCQLAPDEVPLQAERLPIVAGKALLPGTGATAYVCERGRCELPTADPAVLASQLAAVRGY